MDLSMTDIDTQSENSTRATDNIASWYSYVPDIAKE